MMQAADMLRTHPRQSQIEFSVLAKCVDECYACAQACTTCADACLGEASVADLVRCIRLNEDCRAACLATGEMLSRVAEADWSVLRAQVQACVQACRTCGAECERHAGHMEHYRICAEACHACEQACQELLAALPA